MKKWIAGGLLLLILFSFIYIFIPASITVDAHRLIQVNPNAAARLLLNKQNWHYWWPQKNKPHAAGPSEFLYNGFSYRPNEGFFSGLKVTLSHDQVRISSELQIVPLDSTTALNWEATIPSSGNPITRVRQFLWAKTLDKNLEKLAGHIDLFLQNDSNAYSINIERTTVKDTLLIASRMVSSDRPTLSQVYQMVELLRNYIQASGANETNPPMINIKQENSTFQTMVALPVDRPLAGNERLFPKRMVAGNILVAEVKGGPDMVDQAFRQVELYVSDHRLVPPAIPFEMWVTNRLNQPDTSKWVTRIYYPFL